MTRKMIFFSGNRKHKTDDLSLLFTLIKEHHQNICANENSLFSLSLSFSLVMIFSSHARFFFPSRWTQLYVFRWTSNDQMHTLISNSFQDACHRSIIACAQVFDNEMSFEFLDIFHWRDKEKYRRIHTSNGDCFSLCLWLSNNYEKIFTIFK